MTLPKEIGAEIKDYFESGFGGGRENLVLAVLDGKFDVGTTFGSGVGRAGKKATPAATCTRWSTRVIWTWTISSKSGSRR